VPRSQSQTGDQTDGAERAEADDAAQRAAERGKAEAAEDLRLVERVQQGDASAWGPLLERREGQIYATCRRMVSDPETARDLTQDVLVRLIEKIQDFDGRARFSTWMTRITINHCISHLRKQKLRRHASLEAPVRKSGGESIGTLGSSLEQRSEHGVEGGVELTEEAERVAGALRAIDPDHTAILTLRDVQGLDYAQIAETLEVPVGTVKSRLFRARAALREQIERMEKKG
jgi:RNA polymerase sigma-70 factor (ECF subfamily)